MYFNRKVMKLIYNLQNNKSNNQKINAIIILTNKIYRNNLITAY